MSGSLPLARIGLFADGPVGSAVLSILRERCPDQLAYVVIPSRSSDVAHGHAHLGVRAPLFCWQSEGCPTPVWDAGVPDVVLLAWWPNIVGRAFIEAGQAATLNLHPSLLPFGRGKDPNFWALVDGHAYGVTIHHVDDSVDGGDIAFQRALPTTWLDSGGTLYARAQDAIVDLFGASLDAVLRGAIPRIPQNSSIRPRKRAELDPECSIDLDARASFRSMLNLLRGRTFPPHPGCRFQDGGSTYDVRISIEKVLDRT